MQIALRFKDYGGGRSEWSSLRLARFLCDIEHFALVMGALRDLPIDKKRGLLPAVNLTEPFNPKYEDMIVRDFEDASSLAPKTSASPILYIRKSSPLTLIFETAGVAGGVAAGIQIVRGVCKIIIDFQNLRYEKARAEREEDREFIERLRAIKEYEQLRSRLGEERLRLLLDENVMKSAWPFIDGRYPKLTKMGPPPPSKYHGGGSPEVPSTGGGQDEPERQATKTKPGTKAKKSEKTSA